ncbi:hypothetical protein WNZ15_23900 [Roseibium sp. AS2]|uniref:hypothetical protein n=1 Tax=Roseibium sp. AS2 TaxID=3135781 RepID=UPI0031755941
MVSGISLLSPVSVISPSRYKGPICFQTELTTGLNRVGAVRMDEGMTVSAQQDGLRKLRTDMRAGSTDVLKAVQQQTVLSPQVSIEYVTGQLLVFKYGTPSGNQPHDNENAVHFWPVSANSVPFDATPQTNAGILGNTSSGDQSLDARITIAAYVLGYAVGPDATDNIWSPYVNVVASAYIPAAARNGRETDTRTSSIEAKYVGQNTVAFHYAFLAGFNPMAANSWVGLWEGQAATYTTPPSWFSPIIQTNSSGDAALDGLQITKGTPYTLGLFSSGFSEKKDALRLDRLASMTVFERTA